MNQLTFNLPHRQRLGREDFMPDPSNQPALGLIDAWPDWPTPILIVSGPEASGKTHLANIWAKRANAMFIHGRPETELVINPAKLPIIAIDDADRIAAERDLFHAFNHVTNSSGSMLLTASQPPHLWKTTLPDLASRLKAAHHVAIEPPGDTLLAALLLKHLSDRQLAIEHHVVEYLVRRAPRNAIAIATLAARLDELSLAKQRAITVGIARDALEAHDHEQDLGG
jgi:chromosomal replication initiation ATPase DnaA